MQVSDTSALLATTASLEASHWFTLIRREASWKRFAPPRAEAGRAEEDLHCSTPASTPSPPAPWKKTPAVGAVRRGPRRALEAPGEHVSQAREGWPAALCDAALFSGAGPRGGVTGATPRLVRLRGWGAVRVAREKAEKQHPREIVRTLVKLFLSACLSKSEEKADCCFNSLAIVLSGKGPKAERLGQNGHELIIDSRRSALGSAVVSDTIMMVNHWLS